MVSLVLLMKEQPKRKKHEAKKSDIRTKEIEKPNRPVQSESLKQRLVKERRTLLSFFSAFFALPALRMERKSVVIPSPDNLLPEASVEKVGNGQKKAVAGEHEPDEFIWLQNALLYNASLFKEFRLLGQGVKMKTKNKKVKGRAGRRIPSGKTISNTVDLLREGLIYQYI
jgi:hypothetical protein